MADQTYTKEQVNELLQMATNEMAANSHAVTRAQRGQIAALMSGGYDFADTLHNIYLDYGYPAQLDFTNYFNMYRRFGIAKKVVETYPDLGWKDKPIIEGPEKFLLELDEIDKKFYMLNRLKGLDTRQSIGRYAGMFMRVRDNKKPNEPLVGSLNGINTLVSMMPLNEGQLKVLTIENDPTKDDFGLPTMYQLDTSTTGNRNDKSQQSISIHPSRIVIAAEASDNGDIYGVSRLESVYNSLMDLRKIAGGGGEGFYKNASQSIFFSPKDTASAVANKDLLTKFSDQYDEFTRDKMRKGLMTPGLDVQFDNSTLPQPKDFFNNSLNDVAAGSEIPATILVGQQTGRLASSEDMRSLLSRVQSRRVNWQTEMLRNVIDWLMINGVLVSADYTVEWPDALALSRGEMLDNAVKMSGVNNTQILSGESAVYSVDEIREATGFDTEEAPDDPDETLENEEGGEE